MSDTATAEAAIVATIEHLADEMREQASASDIAAMGEAVNNLSEAYAWLRVPRHGG